MVAEKTALRAVLLPPAPKPVEPNFFGGWNIIGGIHTSERG